MFPTRSQPFRGWWWQGPYVDVDGAVHMVLWRNPRGPRAGRWLLDRSDDNGLTWTRPSRPLHDPEGDAWFAFGPGQLAGAALVNGGPDVPEVLRRLRVSTDGRTWRTCRCGPRRSRLAAWRTPPTGRCCWPSRMRGCCGGCAAASRPLTRCTAGRLRWGSRRTGHDHRLPGRPLVLRDDPPAGRLATRAADLPPPEVGVSFGTDSPRLPGWLRPFGGRAPVAFDDHGQTRQPRLVPRRGLRRVPRPGLARADAQRRAGGPSAASPSRAEVAA